MAALDVAYGTAHKRQRIASGDLGWTLICTLVVVLLTARPLGSAAVLIALGVAGVFVAARHFDDFFSPIGVFAGSWFVPLGISQLQLSDLQRPFDAITWIATVGGALSFIAGVLVAPRCFRALPARRIVGSADVRLNSRKLALAITGLFALVVFAYLYEAKLAGGVPLFAEARTIAYATFAQHYIHYLTVSAITVGMLAIGWLVLYRRHRTPLMLALLAGSFVLLFSLLARLQVFTLIVAALVVVNYARPRPLRSRTVALVMVGLVAIMNLVAVIRTDIRLAYASEIGGLDMPAWASVFAWPYLYLALNFEQLRYLMSAGVEQTWGAYTFLPVFALTFTRDLLPGQIDLATTLGWFNTTTFIWPLYSDFRLTGVLTVPFFYGLVSGLLYHRVRSRPSLLVMMLYALVVTCIAFLFFYNLFAYPLMYVIALELWVITAFARRRSSEAVSAG
jgi:oligosaccharide repeat unit polymerase